MGKVIQSIYAFGGLLQSDKSIGWQGPNLGVKQATKNVREFDEKQLREARNAVSRLHSAPIMQRTHIEKTGIATGHDHAGGGGSSEPTKVGLGSGLIMERLHAQKYGITVGAEHSSRAGYSRDTSRESVVSQVSASGSSAEKNAAAQQQAAAEPAAPPQEVESAAQVAPSLAPPPPPPPADFTYTLSDDPDEPEGEL